jgi:hypothetical protein
VRWTQKAEKFSRIKIEQTGNLKIVKLAEVEWRQGCYLLISQQPGVIFSSRIYQTPFNNCQD